MREICVRNPRSGARDYRFRTPAEAELNALAARLRAGQRSWGAAPLAQRLAVLRQWRAALQARRDSILAALCADTGRRFISQVEFDSLLAAAQRWEQAAPRILAHAPRDSQSLPGVRIETALHPYPLVASITPWNLPLLLALLDALPALVAGCAVIVKPSEVTPRFIEPLRQSIRAVPPLAEVLEVVAGDGETGAALIAHADAVCFTGSLRTGRKIAAAAAQRLIPAFLELGGKDPLIIGARANMQRAVTAALRGALLNAGQSCQAIERIYIEESAAEEFCRRLAEAARAVTLSHPDPAQGQLGPLIWEGQARILEAHIADARARGAEVLCGGSIEQLGGGLWLRPTLLARANHEMLAMREESFGPLLPVMACRNLAHAAELAADSQYGLSAAVIAGSEEEALAVARLLPAGAVSIGDAALTTMVHDAEKHAFGKSGLGAARMGDAGLLRFLRRQALLLQRGEPLPLANFDESGAVAAF